MQTDITEYQLKAKDVLAEALLLFLDNSERGFGYVKVSERNTKGKFSVLCRLG